MMFGVKPLAILAFGSVMSCLIWAGVASAIVWSRFGPTAPVALASASV
jgi:hypothetical protein